MRNRIKVNKVYDGKAIWEKYMSLGKASSYRIVAAWCTANGMVSDGLKNATVMGIKFAMWRYAARNPEEAYQTFRTWQLERGEYITFKEFCEMVYDHCVSPHNACVIGVKEKRRFYEKYLTESGWEAESTDIKVHEASPASP